MTSLPQAGTLRSTAVSPRIARRARTLLACLLLAGCGRGAAAGDAKVEQATVVGARTAVAVRRPFTESVTAIGTVAARPGHVAALSAPAPTRITHIFTAVGQRVSAGAPLVELDRAPFDAQARSADVALETAQHSYDRVKRLADAGIVARKDLDQAANDLAQAQAIDVAARRGQQLATLRAPFAGVVTKLAAVMSAAADPSQPLVEVADPAALDILLTVSPAAAARIRAGSDITLTAGQQGSGERLGTGVVVDISATVDTASRGVMVRARLARPTRPLRIGETVFARIVVAMHPDAVTVPTEALVPDGEGFKVFVVDAARIAHGTPVSVGAQADSLSEITSGLAGGEIVVTTGAYGVQDSAKVVPLSGDTAARPSGAAAVARDTAAGPHP